MSTMLPGANPGKGANSGITTFISMLFRSRFCVFNFVKEDDVSALFASIEENRKEDCQKLCGSLFKDYLKELYYKDIGMKFLPTPGQSPNNINVLEGMTSSQPGQEPAPEESEGLKKKKAVFFEYMFNVVDFCHSAGYTKEKCSTIIEIAYRTFYHSFTRRLTQPKSYDYFREVLLRHCHFRPPHSIYVFSLEEIKSISDFFLTSFYRHYAFYLKLFVPHVDVIIRDLGPANQEEGGGKFGRFPFLLDLNSGGEIKKEEVPALMKGYFTEVEQKVSKEEKEEIMKGDSIYSPKKMKEREKKRQEDERKAKIEMVLKRELAKVQEAFEAKLKAQDDAFLAKLEEAKKPKKTK